MRTKLVSTVETDIVPLSAVKAYYRVIGNDEDVTITTTIDTAIAKAEQITNRALKESVYKGYLDSFSKEAIKIPYPPFLEILSITYLSTDGTRKEYTDYKIDNTQEVALLFLESTPTDFTQGLNTIEIEYTAGYKEGEIPAPITSWLLIYGLTLFEQRHNGTIEGGLDNHSISHYNHLLDSYRIVPV